MALQASHHLGELGVDVPAGVGGHCASKSRVLKVQVTNAWAAGVWDQLEYAEMALTGGCWHAGGWL